LFVAYFSTDALHHFAGHHGIASTNQLLAAGMSRHSIRILLDHGNLDSPIKGVYRLPAVPLDELARCAAVCAAHPEAAVSGPTAGRIWGLRRIPRDRRVHILAPPASHPSHERWVVPYRTCAFHPDDFVHRSDGIVLTSRPRTALDLARVLSASDLLSVIEQVMHDGPHTSDEMRRVAVDWISPQRRWLYTYLRLLDRRLGGGSAESHCEVVVGDRLARAKVANLARQFWIDLPGYGPARFDLAVPELRWAVEVDVHPTHRETRGRAGDSWRDRSAAELGWQVERVDPDQYERLDETIERLVDSYQSRRTELGAMS
jgi:very-short-patch-repair endonuclease